MYPKKDSDMLISLIAQLNPTTTPVSIISIFNKGLLQFVRQIKQ